MNSASGTYDRNYIVPCSTERFLHLELSDLHFGADPHPNSQTCPYKENRRFGSVIRQTMNYKRDHRTDTTLGIHVLGDTFEGKLHDVENGAPESLQFIAAKNYLVAGICTLAREYEKVWVFFTPGNHGRNKRRHPERARSDKWDAYETMLYAAVADIVESRCKNVKCVIFGSHYYLQIFDWTIFVTHGDTVFDPGEPHKQINAGRMLAQINEINANRHKKVQMVFTGHNHQGAVLRLPRTRLFSNGGLLPPNEYANSHGKWEANCGQWIVEMTAKHCCGDIRFCETDIFVDRDKTLDKLMPPFDYRGGLNQRG